MLSIKILRRQDKSHWRLDLDRMSREILMAQNEIQGKLDLDWMRLYCPNRS